MLTVHEGIKRQRIDHWKILCVALRIMILKSNLQFFHALQFQSLLCLFGDFKRNSLSTVSLHLSKINLYYSAFIPTYRASTHCYSHYFEIFFMECSLYSVFITLLPTKIQIPSHLNKLKKSF